jgi:hypothetical protein
MMSDKIELKEKLAAVDLNAKSLWDDMDDAQRKSLKQEFFILNRYVSNVNSSDRALQEHFVLTVNEYFNKHWNTLQQHPKLLWQLLCMCSHESRKVYFHQWIGFKKKVGNNKKINFLLSIYPAHKEQDVEALSKILSVDDCKNLAREHGYEEKQIKDLF